METKVAPTFATLVLGFLEKVNYIKTWRNILVLNLKLSYNNHGNDFWTTV